MPISILIPIYNSEFYIEKCIKNILAQTYVEYEVIFVIDHRSSDNSLKIIEEETKLHGNFRYIIQTDDLKLSGARNIGINNAKYDLIWFLDVDDYPYPTFLEELIQIQKDNGADIVFCNHFQELDETVPMIESKKYSVKIFNTNDAISNFTAFPVYSWSRIQKSSLFNEETMFKYHLAAEDIEQTIRIIASSKIICYFNKPLYVYYKRKNSATVKNRVNEIQSIEDTAKSTLEYVKNKCPQAYGQFMIKITERVMRQSAFSTFNDFKDNYKTTIAHEIIKNITKKTFEMKIFSFSGALYYMILFPFTHFIWDRKKGIWDKNN